MQGLCSGIDTHPTCNTKFGTTVGSKEQREGDGLQNYLGVTLKIKMEIIKNRYSIWISLLKTRLQ